jgi:thioredoxin reductase (NADPH)
MSAPETHKLVIIGSGPAGYTAAIYAARANLKPVLYAGIQPGGQLTLTSDVENYPGYPQGILGPQMMEDFRKQAERFGTDIRYSNIARVDFGQSPKVLWDDNGTEVRAHTVIVSTGASAKWLGLESEKRLYGAGVSACAVCDGFFFRGKEVAIIGAGDTAAEEATYLAKMCSKVHMLVRSDKMRASKIMQQRVLNTPNIQVYWNTETKEIVGKDFVEAVRVHDKTKDAVYDIPVSAFFVAIGHQPNTEVFKGQLRMDGNGYIVTEGKSSYTSVDGVFASGDVQDHVYRQAVTAAGSGCMAALDAERWLAAREAQLEPVKA